MFFLVYFMFQFFLVENVFYFDLKDFVFYFYNHNKNLYNEFEFLEN